MGLKCKISYSKGVAKVTDDSGQPSQLYQEVFNLVGDQEQALNIWATAYSKEFGAKGEDASVNDLVKYFDAKVSAESRLSPDEKLQVKDFMRRNGISSLNDLNVQLAKIFKPNGVLEIDTVAAANSGLYSQSEIKELNLDDIADILNKIEGQLILGDITVEPYIQHHEHKNASKKTILGTYEKVPHSEIDMALIKAVDDFSDINSLYAGVKTLPYSDFVYDVLNNEQFAREVMDKFSGMRKIPRLSIVDGELQVGANHRYTTVKNTVLAVADNLVIESEIDFLETIRLDTWEENQEDIKKVLKEIEETLVGYNIDIIGISENSKNRQEVMMLLEATNNLLKGVNNTTVANFASIHNLVIPQEENIIAQVLPEKYADYNIVSLHSEATETELFDRHGLIKVGDNLYHKVDQNANKNDVKDFIYGELVAGRVEIPSEYLITKNLNNKERVLEDISKYLMSRQTTSQFANNELYSAYQVAFNHDVLPKTTNHVGNLVHIRTDEEYLKSSFISDFYNYILREKLKDSGTYRSTLSKFEITDRDITLTEEIDSISGLEFEQELSEYIALKKDSNMKYLLASESMISEDLLYLNFPQEKSEYEGTMISEGEYIITEPIKDNYIKLNGEVYRKELVKDSAELFMRVVTIPNTLYYTSSTNFDLDRVQAKEALDKYGTFSPVIVSETDLKETVAKSRINDNMSPSLKELSTLKDKSYTVFKEGNSFVAYKDGNKVGEITYDVTPQGYSNPRVIMSEAHRSKGVGTELYLNLFDKASKENKEVFGPEVETPQSKNIFLRVGEITKVEVVEESMENVSAVFDSQLELLDLYSSKEEVEIQKKINECAG